MAWMKIYAKVRGILLPKGKLLRKLNVIEAIIEWHTVGLDKEHPITEERMVRADAADVEEQDDEDVNEADKQAGNIEE
jgi:hypothetical protein